MHLEDSDWFTLRSITYYRQKNSLKKPSKAISCFSLPNHILFPLNESEGLACQVYWPRVPTLNPAHVILLLRRPLSRALSLLTVVILATGIAVCSSARGNDVRTIRIRPVYVDTLEAWNTILPYKREARPRIGLVLSGGGARGLSQIGILKVFERHNIPIDFISATSLGATVGGLYAAGYSPGELDSIAVHTNWDEILSLTEDTKRTELFVDQKLAQDRSFLVIRFDGFQPVLPSAVSSGQRLTNYINMLVLQALYHPNPGFDGLRIPFRAVSTDLISGKRAVLGEGSLAEALRASATVPLVFNPVETGGMQLIDGGLLSNIPVDVARDAGCDMVIAVNSTSGLRTEEEMKAPWQTADQIMGIMMQLPNELQLEQADVVITPQIGRHPASDFKGVDSLIRAGEDAAEALVPEILRRYRQIQHANPEDTLAGGEARVIVEHTGGAVPDSLWAALAGVPAGRAVTVQGIRRALNGFYEDGDYQDVYADASTDSNEVRVLYTLVENPVLDSVEVSGCRVVDAREILAQFEPLVGKPINHRESQRALENVVRQYRTQGYSLARIDSVMFDADAGILHLVLNEGIIGAISVVGSERTEDVFVLREFPLEPGDVFEVDKAKLGITNINSTKLFEFVYLEVSYLNRRPILKIRLKERPTQLMRFGLRADNERNLQASIDIRDENFRGSGLELGLTLAGGGRNKSAILEYKANRLFNTLLTFNVSGLFSIFDTYQYADKPQTNPLEFQRIRVGEYRERRYGGRLIFGAQLERFGNATVELSLQNVQIINLENLESLEQRYRLSKIRIGTIVDSKDRDPFPTTGIGVKISYEFAFKGLGSEVGYNAFRFQYESYSTFGGHHTIHPRLTFGFADRTMPLSEQFRLGGRESFYGTNEDDRRGRQLFVVNMEYIYRLPFRIIFDTYFSARYDLGSISTIPEEIKFSTFRHGIGIQLGFDTPVGLAAFAVGKSFYFVRDLPENPIQEGPFHFYFVVGYPL
jgi:NTE family protein